MKGFTYGSKDKERLQAQEGLAKELQHKEKMDERADWKKKLVGFATLGGRMGINPDAIGMRGKVRNGHLYMPLDGGRIDASIDSQRLGQMVNPNTIGANEVDTDIVMRALAEGNSLESLPVVTGLSEKRIGVALKRLTKNKKIEEGVQ